MKNFLFFIMICLSLIITSCYKDEIYSETEIETSPPTNINGVEIKGIVKSLEGKKLDNVVVSFFQNGKQIGETLSDSNGLYNADKIPLDPDIEVTIEYKKQNYAFKYRRLLPEINKESSINVIMGNFDSKDGIQLPSNELKNPSDSNFVKVFGYTKLMNGDPVTGVKCIAVWGYKKFGNNVWFLEESSSDFSDENGYFEMLVPKHKVIHFGMQFLRYPANLFAQCQEHFQIVDNPSIDLPPGLDFNNIGNLSNDHEVITKNDVVFETMYTTIRGRALRCNGSSVKNGILSGGIIASNAFFLAQNVDSNYVFGPNGEFEIYVETCENDQFTDFSSWIKILDTDVLFSGNLNINSFQLENNIGDIILCEDLNDYPDQLTLKLGSDISKTYLNGGDYYLSGSNKISATFNEKIGGNEDDVERIHLKFENYTLGTISKLDLSLKKIRKISGNIWEYYETVFEASPDNVILTISKIEPPYVYGNISGTVNTQQGDKSIDIDFEIYDK